MTAAIIGLLAVFTVATVAEAIRQLARAAQLTRRQPLASGQRRRLAQAVATADATSARQACNRCRTGSAAFPCTCTRDCYAPHCQGGYARCRWCTDDDSQPPAWFGRPCTCGTDCGHGMCQRKPEVAADA